MVSLIWKSFVTCLNFVSRVVSKRTLPILCFCLVIFLIGAQDTLSQTNLLTGNDTAAIVLDGKPLFNLRDFKNFSASERATQVNSTLVKSQWASSVPSVEIVKQNNVLTLQLTHPKTELEPQYLLTITEADLLPGLEAIIQAQDWQQSLNDALQSAHQERNPQYIRQTTIRCGLLTLAVFFIHLCLKGGKKFGKKLESSINENPDDESKARTRLWMDSRFLSLAFLGAQSLLWLSLLFYISDQFPLLRQWRYSFFNNIATRPLFSVNEQSYSAIDLFIFAALLIGLWLAVRSLTVLLRSRILGVLGIQRGLQEAISVLTQYVLTFLGFIIILQLLGIDISSILILGSALGVGIGFGLQNIFNNFISGIILLLERPMEVGNFVKVGDLLGNVVRIGARSTEIRTLDQVTIIVPNSHFVEKEVINWDYSNPVTRVHLPVGVAYGTEIEQARLILLAAVSDHPSVLGYPKPQVLMKGFGDNAIELEVLIWLLKPREQFRIQSDLYYRIEAALREAQVEIPFPQQDLHLRSPQLNQLLTQLLAQYPASKPEGLIYPKQTTSEAPQRHQSAPKIKRKIKSAALSPLDFPALIARMRGENGVAIRDRRHRLNLYPQCFVGSEAVEWLMNDQQIARESAVNLGQALVERGLMHHVLDEHSFKDALLFYRFFEDEQPGQNFVLK